jgi:F-type H+-transporting ATPase subunit b
LALGDIIKSFVQESLEFIIQVFGGDSQEALQQVGIQIISTVLLFLVVRFFFWNKVTDYLEARKAQMADAYESAQAAKAEAAKTNEETKAELHRIRQEAKSMYDEAKERGEEERKRLIAEAKQDAARLVDNAKSDIQMEFEQARQSIREEIITVATQMAGKIIDKELDENDYKTIIERATDEVVDS